MYPMTFSKLLLIDMDPELRYGREVKVDKVDK